MNEDNATVPLYEEFKSLEAKDREIARLREQLVWAHLEHENPIFVQGKAGEHEINVPVTARMLNQLVEENIQLRKQLEATKAGNK